MLSVGEERRLYPCLAKDRKKGKERGVSKQDPAAAAEDPTANCGKFSLQKLKLNPLLPAAG